mmetsp:Transcript_1559/g.4882  ORF Transcript_1559/g.4882 Transcript_1559/m.4882 type:complete len:219 (-) Transcript_1559:129-785(-)
MWFLGETTVRSYDPMSSSFASLAAPHPVPKITTRCFFAGRVAKLSENCLDPTLSTVLSRVCTTLSAPTDPGPFLLSLSGAFAALIITVWRLLTHHPRGALLVHLAAILARPPFMLPAVLLLVWALVDARFIVSSGHPLRASSLPLSLSLSIPAGRSKRVGRPCRLGRCRLGRCRLGRRVREKKTVRASQAKSSPPTHHQREKRSTVVSTCVWARGAYR